MKWYEEAASGKTRYSRTYYFSNISVNTNYTNILLLFITCWLWFAYIQLSELILILI